MRKVISFFVLVSLIDSVMSFTVVRTSMDENSRVDQHYLALIAAHAQCGGDELQAQKSYEALKSIAPEFTSFLYMKFLLNRGHFVQAAFVGEKIEAIARSSHAHDWEIYLNLASIYDALGRDSDVERCFYQARNSAKRQSDQEHIAYNEAVFLLQRKKYDQAISSIDQFLESTIRRSRHAPFYFLKATICLQKSPGDLSAALIAVNGGLEVNGDSIRCLKLKSIIHEQQKDYMAMIETLERVVLLESVPYFRKKLVSALFDLQQFDRAYDHLLRIEDNSIEHLYDLALLSWKMKKRDQALCYIHKALAIDETFVRAKLLKMEIEIEKRDQLIGISYFS